MKKLICIMAILVCSVVGCTNGDQAIRVLSDNGYSDIQITGYSPFACSDSDTFSTGFTAKSSNGKYVSGTVCSGFLKGATIRFN